MAAVCVTGLRAVGARACARYMHVSACVSKVVQFNLSDIGEGIREVTVKSWLVKENDVIAQFDEVCEVESDKATVSITSRFDGRVTRIYHAVGAKALVGSPLLDIDVPDEAADGDGGGGGRGDAEVKEHEKSGSPEANAAPPEVKDSSQSTDTEEKWNKSLATPAVRRIAMENKIKLSDVKGSGKKGRVMKEDILYHLENINGKGKEQILQNISRKPLSSVQKVMVRTMTESLKIPQFLLSDEVDVTKLVQVRSDAKEAALQKGVKLSYLPFFIKAVSKGLSEHPILNSSFDEQKEEIVFKPNHNIGIAVDSPAGLIVPNIKNVQELSVLEVGRELNRLQELASKMKLSPADLTGGTFSVSNIGSIAGTTASPIVLTPEVSILALGRIQRLPRFDSSENIFPASILSISWSADHRVIDGATVARCVEVFRHYIENPTALLLDL